MTDLQLRAVLSGIGFGLWPLLMSRSGLGGNTMSAVYGVVTLAILIPFAFAQGMNLRQIAEANWWVIIPAAIVGSVSLLQFNGGLAKYGGGPNIGTFIVLMTLVQISIPAIYDILRGGISTTKLIGFVLAGVSAYFLNQK